MFFIEGNGHQRGGCAADHRILTPFEVQCFA